MRITKLAGTGLCGVAATFVVAAGASATDWMQFDFDPAHSGTNPQETLILKSPGSPQDVSTLHPLWNVALPATADGAPVFLSGAGTPLGTLDLLFVVTKDGRIIALDAASGRTVWSHQTNPSPPPAGQDYTTSSPAIDPNRQYVYAFGLDGALDPVTNTHVDAYVHKYQVGSGTEVTGGGWPELATRKLDVEKGSSAVAIATARNGTTYLYMTNGGYPGDAGDYQGHVTTIDLASGAQNVFNANCSDQTVHFVENATPDCAQVQTAIWARPGVIYDAALDRIFMATGNGTFDANSPTAPNHDWSETVFSLTPSGQGANGKPLDSYTPTNFQSLDNGDADLGSTAPAILPAPAGSKYPHLAMQSGKDGMVRLLNLDNLSGAGGAGHTGGELQLIGVPQGGEVLPQAAVWVNPADSSTWVFIGNGNGNSGLKLTVDGSGNPSLTPVWNNGDLSSSPIVADGILFYAGGNGVTARDPVTGTQLWNDNSIGGIHWESPIVVNGKLYVTDENGQLWAYGLDEIFKNGFE